MTAIQPTYTRYANVRDRIQDGDLLLFRRRGLSGAAIGAAGRSIYSHAAIAAWWSESLMCVETGERFGGRAVRLSPLVAASPCRIDVYEVKVWDCHREAIVSAMRQHTGRKYGWATIVWHLWRIAPVVRWFVSPPMDDGANGSPAVCSSLISRACKSAGYDPVPNLSDRATTPGDLGRSALFEYRWTLTE